MKDNDGDGDDNHTHNDKRRRLRERIPPDRNGEGHPTTTTTTAIQRGGRPRRRARDGDEDPHSSSRLEALVTFSMPRDGMCKECGSLFSAGNRRTAYKYVDRRNPEAFTLKFACGTCESPLSIYTPPEHSQMMFGENLVEPSAERALGFRFDYGDDDDDHEKKGGRAARHNDLEIDRMSIKSVENGERDEEKEEPSESDDDEDDVIEEDAVALYLKKKKERDDAMMRSRLPHIAAAAASSTSHVKTSFTNPPQPPPTFTSDWASLVKTTRKTGLMIGGKKKNQDDEEKGDDDGTSVMDRTTFRAYDPPPVSDFQKLQRVRSQYYGDALSSRLLLGEEEEEHNSLRKPKTSSDGSREAPKRLLNEVIKRGRTLRKRKAAKA